MGDPRFARDLFGGSARRYDIVSEALSFGQYRRWQHRLVAAAAEAGVGVGDRVLDVATGTGKIARSLRARLGCRVVGLDLTADMLQENAGRADSPRPLSLVHADASWPPFRPATFDALTFSYLLRYVEEPDETVARLVELVRPGGFVGFVEFHVPADPMVLALWRAHTRVNLPIGGVLAGGPWLRIGRFLGPDIERFYGRVDVQTMRQWLVRAGLEAVDFQVMSLGGGVVMWGRRRDDA